MYYRWAFVKSPPRATVDATPSARNISVEYSDYLVNGGTCFDESKHFIQQTTKNRIGRLIFHCKLLFCSIKSETIFIFFFYLIVFLYIVKRSTFITVIKIGKVVDTLNKSLIELLIFSNLCLRSASYYVNLFSILYK